MYRDAADALILPVRRATGATHRRMYAMSEHVATTDRSADLKALYPTVIAPTGCRTCGIAGWDKALQSR